MPEASACEELGDGECDMGVVVVSSSESSLRVCRYIDGGLLLLHIAR